MNNIVCIEAMQDGFGKEFYDRYVVKCARVKFLSESIFDDNVSIFRSDIEDGVCYVYGENSRTGKAVFECAVEIEEHE